MANISVAEAKNKLPHFIHQTEVSGPIIISRRNQDVAVLISKNDYFPPLKITTQMVLHGKIIFLMEFLNDSKI